MVTNTFTAGGGRLRQRPPGGGPTAPPRGPRPAGGGRRIGPGTVAAVGLAGGFLAAVAWGVSLPLAGILFVVMIVATTAVRPDVTFFLVFLAAPWVYDIGGGPVKMAAADLMLVLAVPALAVRFATSGRRWMRNPMTWPILAYFAVCVASALVNGGDVGGNGGGDGGGNGGGNGGLAEAATSLFQMALYMVLVVSVYANCVDDPGRMIASVQGLLVSNCVIAAAVLVLRSNYVLGLHKNAAGAELSYAVTIAAELWLARAAGRRPKWALTGMLLVLVAGLVNSLSRGAWLGTVVGVLVLMVLRRQARLALQGLAVAVPSVAVCWALLPQASRDYAVNFGHGAHNIEARYFDFYYALDRFRDSPILGVGVGLRKTYDATNLAMSTLAETGVLGMATFAAVFVAFGWMVLWTRRRLSPTEPAFSCMALGAALMAGKVAHGCVDHYWSRVMLPVWASAGLAVYAYNVARGRAAGPAVGAAVGPRGRRGGGAGGRA